MYTARTPIAFLRHERDIPHLLNEKCRDNGYSGTTRVYQWQNSFAAPIPLHRLWWQYNSGKVHSSLQSLRRGVYIAVYWGNTSSSRPTWYSHRNIITGIYLGRTWWMMNTQTEMIVSDLQQWGAKKNKKLMHEGRWYLNET